MNFLTHVVRLLLRDKLDSQVTGALTDARRAAERARAVTLQRRTLVHVRLADSKLVGDQLMVVLRVGDRGLQQLEHVARRGARRVREDRTRLADVLAADVVDHEAGLARRAAHVLRARANRHVAVLATARRRLRAAGSPGGGSATTAAGRSGLLLSCFGLGRLGGSLLGLLGLGLFSLGLLSLGVLSLLGSRLARALRLWLLLSLCLLLCAFCLLRVRLLRRGLARALGLRLLLGRVVLLLLVVSH